MLTTAELARLLDGRLVGPGGVTLTHVEALDRAGPGGLTFVRDAAFLGAWTQSRASAAILAHRATEGIDIDALAVGERSLIVVADADLAMARATALFAPKTPPPTPGVDSSAVVDPTARVAPGASVGPCCVVGPGAVVAEGAVLVAHVYVGREASIGARTVLHPNAAVLDRCAVGADCILHVGVAIGADGFGYRPRADGRGLEKLPHIGNVLIEDEVEIGANSCVDRAKFGSTFIGRGTKIDNLVQIGHNCRIGRSCIICGECGLAGSVTLGDGVMLGGKVGIADNAVIGAGAKLAAYAAVLGDVPAGATYMGMPAGPVDEMRRAYVAFRKLGRRPAPKATVKATGGPTP